MRPRRSFLTRIEMWQPAVVLIPILFIGWMAWRHSWTRCRWQIRRLPEVPAASTTEEVTGA